MYRRPRATLQDVVRRLHRIEWKVDLLMTDQEHLDQDVVALEAGIAGVAQEIQDLKNTNPGVDFTGLDKAVADLAALAPAAPAPAPEPSPGG